MNLFAIFAMALLGYFASIMFLVNIEFYRVPWVRVAWRRVGIVLWWGTIITGLIALFGH